MKPDSFPMCWILLGLRPTANVWSASVFLSRANFHLLSNHPFWKVLSLFKLYVNVMFGASANHQKQLNHNLSLFHIVSNLYVFHLASASKIPKSICCFKFVNPKLWSWWNLVVNDNIPLQSEGVKSPTVMLAHKAMGEMSLLFTQLQQRIFWQFEGNRPP